MLSGCFSFLGKRKKIINILYRIYFSAGVWYNKMDFWKAMEAYI